MRAWNPLDRAYFLLSTSLLSYLMHYSYDLLLVERRMICDIYN